ncbi:MAG: hypothetical protein WEC15_07640 [Flavobacteriales bacterium]
MNFPVIRTFLSKALVVALCAVVVSACNKEKPTKAIIVVKNEAGAVVPGVEVRLFANPSFPLGDPTRLNQEGVTSASGRVEFDYTDFYKQGQAGFAVLDILAVTEDFSGAGIIKILEEETNEETVVLLPI